jgi:hypothetical protein
MDPEKIIKDYLDDPGYQIGDTLEYHVNISAVTDLFAWQVNVTWDPAMLNFTGVVYGDFLSQTTSPNGTSSNNPDLNVTIVDASNVTGYASIAETILGDYPGVNGSGRLVTLKFLIVGYGCTEFKVSISGILPTTLLNSTIIDGQPGTIPFTTADGYFRNKLKGDANGDTIVDVFDVSKVKYHRSGPPPGPGGYERNVDINDDGDIDIFDLSIVKANRGRSVDL